MSTLAPSPRPYLTASELAAEFRLPLGEIHAWRAEGIGPASFRVGSQLVYRRSDVDAWFAANAPARVR